MIQGEEDSPTQRDKGWSTGKAVTKTCSVADPRGAPEHPVNTEIQITTRRPLKWNIQTATLEGCGGGNVGSK